MKRSLATKVMKQESKTVTLMGWVNSRRDHGGLIFIDLRDESGIVQLTCTPDKSNVFGVAESIRDEFVIKATGKVTKRANDLINDKIETGQYEVVLSELEVLNASQPLPFQIHDTKAGEETRLKYRYLDLRRPKMQAMLKMRSEFNKYVRNYMEDLDFIEVVTPILTNSSPEGARDYLVPSRLHPGKFYALPQAPQQFKQLLMVGGLPRYYQIAPVFRDEDPRADRHTGEFYQLDLEKAFVEDGEEIRSMIEPLITGLVKEFADLNIVDESIPRITYEEAMNKYGSDKPDLRYDMALVDLSEIMANVEFGVFSKAVAEGGVVKAIVAEKGADLSRSQIDKFTDLVKSEGAGGLPYMTIEAGGEVKSPIAKFFTEDQLKQIVEKTEAPEGSIIFFGSDKLDVVNKSLGKLRVALADHFELKDPNLVSLLWVVDFPFYEINESTGKLDFGHNPFSMPKGGVKALEADDKLSIVADQYDMVGNGYELCSGGVRNHSPEIMYKAFANVGFDKQYVDNNFSAMIEAFKFGAPPHAGCAFGTERLMMILNNEPNIREIIAFPLNGAAVDVMSGAPLPVSDSQLADLHIQLDIED